jgi:hypothetical protein
MGAGLRAPPRIDMRSRPGLPGRDSREDHDENEQEDRAPTNGSRSGPRPPNRQAGLARCGGRAAPNVGVHACH